MNKKGQAPISLASLFLLIYISISVSPLKGQTPTNNCPAPQNDCAAACGTYCTYWSCNNPKLTPQFTINQLPNTTIWWEEQGCFGKEHRVYINQLRKTYTVGPAGSQTNIDLKAIPHVVAPLRTWACLQNSKYGGCCAWSWNTGACRATCGYNTVSGTQLVAPYCNSPDGNCCGPQPAAYNQACSISCPPPPAPNVVSIETHPTNCVSMAARFQSWCNFIITFDQDFDDDMNLTKITINDDSLGSGNPSPIISRTRINRRQVVIDTDNTWCDGGLCNSHWYTVTVPAGTVSYFGAPSKPSSRSGQTDPPSAKWSFFQIFCPHKKDLSVLSLWKKIVISAGHYCS